MTSFENRKLELLWVEPKMQRQLKEKHTILFKSKKSPIAKWQRQFLKGFCNSSRRRLPVQGFLTWPQFFKGNSPRLPFCAFFLLSFHFWRKLYFISTILKSFLVKSMSYFVQPSFLEELEFSFLRLSTFNSIYDIKLNAHTCIWITILYIIKY